MCAAPELELKPEIWPASATRSASGELTVGGVGVAALAAEFGTPLYLFDQHDLLGRAKRIHEVFSAAAARVGTTATIYYAGKALLTAQIANWMHELGLHIDVASAGELAIALAGGVPAGMIGVHGNNKSLEEIERAVRVGVGSIVLDSPIEIERVAETAARLGTVQPVRLRVNSGVHAHTHEFLATAHEDQKFGVSMATAPELVARIRSLPSLSFLGLHCHIGSQIFDASGFAESAARLLELQRDLLSDGPVPELNLGGGFGVAYIETDSPSPIEQLAESICQTVATEAARLGIAAPALVFEPGRWIVANPGITLYEVGTVKPVKLEDGRSRLYVSVDGGISDNARPMLYNAQYTSRIASRRSSAAPALSRLVGKHCEAGDILIHDADLPADIAPGDLLAVAATGAYGHSLANNYNALLRPAIVAVADGQARLLVRRETEADLLARDLGVLENH